MPTPTPMVIDRAGKSPRAWDLYSRLMEDRVIFLSGVVNSEMATSVVAQLLFLQYSNADKEISMYIASPGGAVTAGLAIYDTMQYIKPDIRTICIGEAASMGAILLAAGTKGKRFSLPHSRMMIHQPNSGYSGQASDVVIHANEVSRIKSRLETILSKHTGKTVEQVSKDSDRDNYMDAEEAVQYGLIDKIIESV